MWTLNCIFHAGRPTVSEQRPLLPDHGEGQTADGASIHTKDTSSSVTSTLEGSHDHNYSDSDSDDEDAYIKKHQKQRLQAAGNWFTYIKAYSIFLPFLIPKKDRKVQACLIVSLLCLLAERVLNVLIPRQLGIIANRLITKEIPFVELGIWLILSLLSDGTGVFMVQELVKIPLKQFSYRQITTAAFQHVMSLSMDFHSDRDSAEVMKAIEQGESMNDLLEAALLEIAPTIIDLLVAYVYLWQVFDIYTCMLMIVASIAYITTDIIASNWNISNRRRVTSAEAQEAKVMHQAVQGWETANYFNRIDYETRRFTKAVDTHLAAGRDWAQLDAYSTTLMNSVVPVTFFGMSCLIFYQIFLGKSTPGDYVFFIQYWERLIYPLKYLSSHYRWLMADLIHAERLLMLFQTKPSICDKEDAIDLLAIKGDVTFKHVHYSYPDRAPALFDVKITAPAGSTIALVGSTGAGKSTILKLLLRLYDVSSGSIEIDNHDIRDLSLSSLRSAIAVVPQTPLLFNASIMDNIRYARLDATDAEVHGACRAAALHTQILTFPLQYATQVGENGMKLSGGELQRVAIARAILKNPAIFVLDEAMSAVDTTTEAEIQDAFRSLMRQQGRTTFVIAHRLSTVVDADEILVVDGGRIVERGTHVELLRQGGRYALLWRGQVSGESVGVGDVTDVVLS